MPEEVLRLAIDPRRAVRGAREFRAAAGSATTSAETLAAATKGLAVAFAAFGAAQGVRASIRAAIDWETALTGVAKTVDETEVRIAQLGVELQELSKTIPVAAGELAGIAEAAGQLGIQTDNIVSFTRVMADLGVATNLTAEQAATSLARLANVMGTPQSAFDRLGATIVDLGNNLATTEAEITEFATRMAGAGRIAGLTEANILAIGGAMSSVGIEAEAGGTAVQKALIDINTAVAQGNESLSVFADVAGMSASEFQRAWREDAGTAFTAFVEGLGRAGDDATTVLDQLGLSNQRLVRAFLSLANAGPLLRDSIGRANVAWEENNALTAEAERFYKTLGNQLTVLRNQLSVAAAELGGRFTPAIQAAIDNVDLLIDATKALAGAAAIGGLTAGIILLLNAIGPTVTILATLANTMGVATAAVIALEASIAGVAALLTPGVGIIAGLALLGAGIFAVTRKSREMREEMERQRDAISETADAMKTLSQEAVRATLANLGQVASSIQTEIARLKSEIDTSAGAGAAAAPQTARLQGELRAQQAQLQQINTLIEGAADRWVSFGDAAENAARKVAEIGEQFELIGIGGFDPSEASELRSLQSELQAIVEDTAASDQARIDATRLLAQVTGELKSLTAGVAEEVDEVIARSDSLSAAYELGLTTVGETLSEFEELRDLLSDIADDEERARDQRVEAARELLEVEEEIARVRGTQAMLDRASTGTLPRRDINPRVGIPGAGQIFLPSIEGTSTALSDFERTLQLLLARIREADEETESWAQQIDPAVRGIIAVADGFGLIEGRARDAVRGLSDIAGGIASLQGAAEQQGGFGKALSTAGGIASLLPGAGQVIGGLAGLVGGLFGGGGPSEEEILARERNELLKENLQALDRLELTQRQTTDQTVRELSNILGRESVLEGGDLSGGPGDISHLITDRDPRVLRIAEAAGIDLFDSLGNLLPGAVDQFIDALQLLQEEIDRNQAIFRDEIEVRRLLAQGADEEADALRRELQNRKEIQDALRRGFDEATIAALREVQALEEEARAKEEAARAAEEAARQERQRAATLSDFAARAAALEGEDIEALRIRREAAAAQELAALEELVEAGTITADEFERFAAVLDGEVDAAVQDAINAANERARAEREAAEAARFRAMVDMENLRVRNLVARGMDREAEALRAQLEIMNAVNDGRSEEYIQLLRQTLAIEQQNRAERDRQRAIEETTRQIDGMTRVLNGPAGFSVALRQAQTLGVGSPVFGVQTPNFQQPIQGGSGDINIQSVTIQAAPGDSGADLWAKFQEEARRQARATGSNPFDGIGEG